MKQLLILLVLFIASPISAQPRNSPKADAAPTTAIDGSYREVSWDALLPKGWDPAKRFRELNLDMLNDGDPRAMEALDMIKQEWDSAPIETSLDGRKIKIAGFVVPIEEQGRAVREFLLVPYFGACIHVPPPPANQIIHVVSAKPIKNLRVMDAVWVAGEVKVARYSKPTPMGMGVAGYRINSTSVTAYEEPAKATNRRSR
jgi:hypothetical protein